jgi:hypothetical protein
MPVERRRFPSPRDIEEHNASCFIVMDANRFPVCYVYFESEPGRRAAANLMTRDEARRVAALPGCRSYWASHSRKVTRSFSDDPNPSRFGDLVTGAKRKAPVGRGLEAVLCVGGNTLSQ